MLIRKLVSAILLLAIPLTPLYPSNIPPQAIYQKIRGESNFTKAPYTPYYDEILQFLEEIESGEMEKKCTLEELEEINQFLAFLAKEGVRSEENNSLDSDVKALLNTLVSHHHSFDSATTSPAALMCNLHIPKCIKKVGVRCKNWISNRFDKCSAFFTGRNNTHQALASSNWTQTKEFVEKHKVALIVGVVIVVTVIVVTIAVVTSSSDKETNIHRDVGIVLMSTGAGAAGATKALESPESKEKAVKSLLDEPYLKQTISEQIKNEIVHESCYSLEEQGRECGSRVAHENFEYLIDRFPLTNERSSDYSIAGHKEIDRQFSTIQFSQGFAKGLPHGIYDSGAQLCLLAKEIVLHPINTTEQMYYALDALSTIARSGEWSAIGETLAPEVSHLIHEWDYLSSEEKGEQSGYILGKYGADILIPGAVVKGTSIIVKGVEELSIASKALHATEKTLLMEAATAAEKGAQVSQKAITLIDEGAIAIHEAPPKIKYIFQDPVLHESRELFNQAKEFLKPYVKEFLSETEARELIHQTGIKTFPRPEGIPESFKIQLSDRGAGMKYVHPENEHISVRVMPGKLHSPLPHQQKPYVVHMQDGKAFDKFGNIVSKQSPEAHIPIEEFIYRSE